MNMAVFEAKLLTSMLVRKFSFELVPGEAEKITYSLMLTMSIANSSDGTSHQLKMIPTLRKQ